MSFVQATRKYCPHCEGVSHITRTKELPWKAMFLWLSVFSIMLVVGLIVKK